MTYATKQTSVNFKRLKTWKISFLTTLKCNEKSITETKLEIGNKAYIPNNQWLKESQEEWEYSSRWMMIKTHYNKSYGLQQCLEATL